MRHIHLFWFAPLKFVVSCSQQDPCILKTAKNVACSLSEKVPSVGCLFRLKLECLARCFICKYHQMAFFHLENTRFACESRVGGVCPRKGTQVKSCVKSCLMIKCSSIASILLWLYYKLCAIKRTIDDGLSAAGRKIYF